MTQLALQERIQHVIKTPVKLRINDNRSTYLSVRWYPQHTSISLHRFFLDAPIPIIDALLPYLSGKKKQLPTIVKTYIEERSQDLDYTHRRNTLDLVAEGRCFNLNTLMDKVNQEYFLGRISLQITWFGDRPKRKRKRLTLGLYDSATQLVKVHRLLDNPLVPEYVVRFIIYHEILHHVIPPYHGPTGRLRIHSPEFRQKEKLFQDYERAKKWIKDHSFNI